MADKPRISHRKKARNLLVQAIYQWQMTGNPVDEIAAQYRADNEAKIDWDFFHAAFDLITSDVAALDAIFIPYLDREVDQLTPIELAILRLGIFELRDRIDVPYRVVINEYVDLGKKFGATDSHKYINGILDKVARQLRQPELNAGA